jgi:hypothetical protein
MCNLPSLFRLVCQLSEEISQLKVDLTKRDSEIVNLKQLAETRSNQISNLEDDLDTKEKDILQ